MSVDRLPVLEQHGRAYGDLRLAIGWTDGHLGERAKRSKHWQARPDRLGDSEHGAAILHRGLTRNPVVSLAASNLIGIDIDGEAGHELARKLIPGGFPMTVAVHSGRADGGVHLWFRPPIGGRPAKIEFSADGLEVSRDGYLVCPPGLHETGAVYSFAAGRAPWDIPIAVLPGSLYKLFTDARRVLDEAERADVETPIPPGARHRHLRRVAGAMRRAGALEESICEALLVENRRRCDPPKDERLVRELARDIAKRYAPGARVE